METVFFEDFVQLQRGFDLPEPQRKEGKFPVIASTSIVGYHNQFKVIPPCVITGRSGSLGFVQIIEMPCFPLNTTLFVKDFKGNNPRFVYYFLKTLKLENFNSGAGVPTLNRNDLNKYKIRIPKPHIQQQIAEILGRYDELIETHQQQIKILELIAQEIYREMFVRRIDKENLPSNWKEMCLGEIAKESRQVIKIEDVVEETRYVGLEHLSIKSLVIKDFGFAEDVDSDKLKFEKGDILFGKIRPYLHKVCLSHFKGICSSDTIVIKPTFENILGFLIFTVFDATFIEFADKISNGTKMPRAEWKVLKTYKIIVPDDNSLKKFDKIFTPMFANISNLQSQISKLQEMRDKLLPRLLNGELIK